MDVLVGWVLFVREFGLDFESVRPEVVALGLKKVCWQIFGAVAVVEAQGSAEGWSWYSPECRLAHNISPAILSVVDCLVEKIVEKQILKVGIVAVGFRDIFQEH